MRALVVAAAVLLGTGAAFAQAQEPAPPVVAYRTVTLKSKVLGEDRVVFVHAPSTYGRSADERFPVLYLTDAESQFLHTVITSEFLAEMGRVPPMVVVGVTNTDRGRDLLPTAAPYKGGDGPPRTIPGAGGAEKFLDFFRTELIPWVEANYRTRPFRVFAGHSFGGLFAVHATFAHPDLFQAAIAASPTLQWDDDLPMKEAKKHFDAHPDAKGALFFTCGDEERPLVEGFERFRALLASKAPKSFRWDAAQWKDEDHGTIVLHTNDIGLRMVFDGWLPPRRVMTGAPADLKAHYRALSARMGYDVAVPEVIMNAAGYRLLQAGRVPEAIAAFEENAKAYPASPNVHDSLADALEASGQKERARAEVMKAVDLATKTNDRLLPEFRKHLQRLMD